MTVLRASGTVKMRGHAVYLLGLLVITSCGQPSPMGMKDAARVRTDPAIASLDANGSIHVLAHLRESNDAQYLIRQDGSVGGLVMLWVSEPAPASFSNLLWDLVAEIGIDDDPDGNAGKPSDVPLEMTGNYSCVYLREDRSGKLVATTMSPWIFTGQCLTSVPYAFNTNQKLKVRVAPDDGTPEGKAPLAARLDWNGSGKHTMHIGVKCGNAWCDISENASQSSNHPTFPRGKSKGWYDEQYLLTKVTAGAKVTPGNALGTIIPIEKLADYDTEAKFTCVSNPCGKDQGWIYVSDVLLTDTDPYYKQKFNFDKTSANTTNKLYLRRLALQIPKWQARIVSANGDVGEILKVNYDSHEDQPHVPIGAARWRPKNNDEQMWIRCALGCCEVTEDRDA